MTTYAGELLTITHTADVEGTALTDVVVTEVTIEIYTVADEEEILDSAVMTWNDTPTPPRWEYQWDTSALAFGTYIARCKIDGDNWEYKRIRLARNKFVVD